MTSTSLLDDYLDPSGDSVFFTDAQWLQALLRFESALASAQADCGLLPRQTAEAIEKACEAVDPDRERFVQKARSTGALGMAVVEPLREWLRKEAPQAVAGL